MVCATEIQMNSSFSVANNKVPVEDIIEMHNIENTLTKEARYNARITCHYIAWTLKIFLGFLMS